LARGWDICSRPEGEEGPGERDFCSGAYTWGRASMTEWALLGPAPSENGKKGRKQGKKERPDRKILEKKKKNILTRI